MSGDSHHETDRINPFAAAGLVWLVAAPTLVLAANADVPTVVEVGPSVGLALVTLWTLMYGPRASL